MRTCRPDFVRFASLLAAFLALTLSLGACSGPDKPPVTNIDSGNQTDNSCKSNSECEIGKECIDGKCQKPEVECRTDDDCHEKAVCRANRCYAMKPDGGVQDTNMTVTDAGDTSSTNGDVEPGQDIPKGLDGDSCSGCILKSDAGSRCAPGNTTEACGSGGATCQVCKPDEECKNGMCQTKSCTSSNCNGCCDGDKCVDGDMNSACGTGGEECETCTGDAQCTGGSCEIPCSESCSGCCTAMGKCENGDKDSACGSGGSMCKSCGSDEQCSNGRCAKLSCKMKCSTMGNDGCCWFGQCKPGTSDNRCGSGGEACDTCDPGFECDSLQRCDLDENSRWDVVAVEGSVPKSDENQVFWDHRWNNPDPYVIVEVKGQVTVKGQTSSKSGKLNPTWNEKTAKDVPASDLKGYHNVTMRIMDSDTFGDAEIAKCVMDFDERHFDGGIYKFNCTNHKNSSNPVKTWVKFKLLHNP